jgi:hypothetical protein
MHGCEEIDCETIVSDGDATEVLQATEHALDGVAASIEDGQEAILPVSVRPPAPQTFKAQLLQLDQCAAVQSAAGL